MPHACVALTSAPLPDLHAVRDQSRRMLAFAAGALQVAGFAATLWLFAAGPGFLAEHASTIQLDARH